jgi:hypothetical protein
MAAGELEFALLSSHRTTETTAASHRIFAEVAGDDHFRGRA